MWYFADGDQKLIRLHTDAPMGSAAFYNAHSERYTARAGWVPSASGFNLASEAINSGDYTPVGDPVEIARIMAAMHQQMLGFSRPQ